MPETTEPLLSLRNIAFTYRALGGGIHPRVPGTGLLSRQVPQLRTGPGTTVEHAPLCHGPGFFDVAPVGMQAGELQVDRGIVRIYALGSLQERLATREITGESRGPGLAQQTRTGVTGTARIISRGRTGRLGCDINRPATGAGTGGQQAEQAGN